MLDYATGVVSNLMADKLGHGGWERGRVSDAGVTRYSVS